MATFEKNIVFRVDPQLQKLLQLMAKTTERDTVSDFVRDVMFYLANNSEVLEAITPYLKDYREGIDAQKETN